MSGGGKWQPIATAPGNGAYVLVCGNTTTGRRAIVASLMRFDDWGPVWVTNIAGQSADCGAVHYCMVENVTHWMPLPELPKVRH
jgi:hypothetical protein